MEPPGVDSGGNSQHVMGGAGCNAQTAFFAALLINDYFTLICSPPSGIITHFFFAGQNAPGAQR